MWVQRMTLNSPSRLTCDSEDIAEELGKRCERQHDDRQLPTVVFELGASAADQRDRPSCSIATWADHWRRQ